MFIDSARISIKGGDGGNGCVSFRREKYVPAGGPDGGDGGAGGSAILLGDGGMHTLSDFRYKTKYRAQNGAPGSSSNCAGKSGDDLIIKVPLGTLAYDAVDGRLVADITADGQAVIIARGGKGGAGNQHFATPTRQAPNFAKTGTKGEEIDLSIELKVLADVGLVGYPNVGKSTLLSVVSSARPKIADYHFTTLTPNLGVVDVGEPGDMSSFVIADIPGLIEGAHAGVGLGDAFLKHIERTRILVHVVDAAGTEGRVPADDFIAINRELESFNVDLADRPQIVAANKMDAMDGGEDSGKRLDALKSEAEKLGYPVYEISAATKHGIDGLIAAIWERLFEMRSIDNEFSDENKVSPDGSAGGVLITNRPSAPRFSVDVVDGIYVLTGNWIEKLMSDINIDDHESLQYFQTALKKFGIIDALEKRGINGGDTVKIGDTEFDYIG